jgi:hypothetical protein
MRALAPAALAVPALAALALRGREARAGCADLR